MTGRGALAGEVRAGAACLAGGLLGGVVWAVLAPAASQRWTSSGEGAFAVEGTLAVLGVLAGILTAAALVVRPGRAPAVRLLVLLVAATVGSGLAWFVGSRLLEPDVALTVPAVVLTWPLTTAVLTAVRSLAENLRASRPGGP